MELKAIESTTRATGRLNAALKIYRETILPEAQNPEQQIIYWIEQSKQNRADEFKCFALLEKGKVVGYLQYSYFAEERIFFFEYLCLRSSPSQGLAPSSAISVIRDFLYENYPPDFIVVFEVAQTQSSPGTWVPDKKLISYFKRLGFRKLDFEYRYPALQSYDPDTSYPADLMVSLPDGRKNVSSSELRTILRCIYFKHYLRWDRPFLKSEQFREREQMIDKLYSTQIAKIPKHGSYETAGTDASIKGRFSRGYIRIVPLLKHIFGPKFPRLLIMCVLMLALEQRLGSVWVLIPFVLAVAALYCLAEDTDSSRKLFGAIIRRFSVGRPRSS